MADILQPSDQFLVNRADSTKTVTTENLMAELQDTDLMLVNRSDTTYKITGKDLKDSVQPDVQPPTVAGAILSGGPGFSGQTYTTSLVSYTPGVPSATQGLKAKVSGALSVPGQTSPITNIDNIKYVDDVFAINSNAEGYFSGDPTTITNVSPVGQFSYSSYAVGLMFDGNVVSSSATSCRMVGGGAAYGNGCESFHFELAANNIVPGDTFDVYNRGATNTADYKPWSAIFLKADGSSIAGYTDFRANATWGWTTLTVPNEATAIRFLSYLLSTDYCQTYIAGYRHNGNLLINGTGTILTLADRTNLDNGAFVKGDVVTGYTGSGGPPAAFAPVTYTGNGGTQDINCGFAPDLVWIKSRSQAYNNCLFDTVRGAGERLVSNDTQAEASYPLAFASFNANGFTVSEYDTTNSSGATFVAWCWKASGSTVTNNDGDRESQVRAGNGFSIATFKSPPSSTGDFTVGHGLGTAPKMAICKCLNETSNWQVWFDGFTVQEALKLNESQGVNTGTGYWGANLPTASVMGITTGNGVPSNADCIMYSFAETPGVSSFGSYTGTEAEQPIDLGFAAAFVLIKATNGGEQWYVYDIARQTSSTYPMLNPNLADAEATTASRAVKLTSSGFTLLGTDSAINGLGRNYIYAAFAEGDPPVTVEAISTTADEMTVSGGDWENGQTVKNTVVNPITGVPVSDEITGVEEVTNDYASKLSSSSLTWYGTSYPENAFDGSTSTSACPGVKSASIIWTPDAFTGEVELYLDQVDQNGFKLILPDGSEIAGSTLPNQSWANIGTLTFDGTQALEIFAPSWKYLYGVKVDGTVLKDGTNTQLTLDSESGLANFADGYDCYQDSGYAAETSEITGVSASSVSKVKAYYSAVVPNNLAEAITGTEYDLTLSNTNVIENSHYLTLVCEDGCPTSGQVWKTNGGPIFDMKYTNGSGNFTADGTQLDDSGNPPSGPSDTTDILFSDGGTTGYIVNIQAAYTILATTNLGTTPVVSDAAQGEETTLSFDDSTDLDVFEPGDVVQEDKAPQVISYFPGNPNVFIERAAGQEYIRMTNLADYTALVTDKWTSKEGGTLILRLYNNNANGTSPVTITFEGINCTSYNVGDASSGTFDIADGGAGTDLYINFTGAGSFTLTALNKDGGHVMYYMDYGGTVSYWTADGASQVVCDNTVWGVGTEVKVVSVGPGNTMTVDGGDWTATPATGIQVVLTDVDGYGWYDYNGTLRPLSEINNPSNGIIPQSYFTPELNDSKKNGNKGVYISSANMYVEFSYSNAAVGDKIKIVFGSPSTIAGDYQMKANVTGDVDETGISVLVPTTSNVGKNELPKFEVEFTVSDTSGTLKIQSISNDIGGSSDVYYYWWSSASTGAQNKVTCTYQAGTGTVAGTSGSTMTLNPSDNAYPKRWVANHGKYVTGDPVPLVESTGYLEFSGSQVTGIVSNDPGYKPAPASLELTFTDPSPTGGTWDSELPSGTTIQTRVLATNDLGSADTGWSNQVVGFCLSPECTQEELNQVYAETAAKLATFENRAGYHQGQEAQEARDSLRESVAAQLGISTAELEQLLDEVE